MNHSTMSIVRYDVDFIDELSKKITTELDEVTIKKLLEIKVNNKFITQSNPLVLKYIAEGNTAIFGEMKKRIKLRIIFLYLPKS